MEKRAWAVLDIKAVSETDGERIIEGIATTPSTDRLGDVVEPMGANFKLPLPFLHQHNSTEPVGHVTFAKPNKSGIPFKAKLVSPTADMPASLIDRLNVAWHEIKTKLVRGVSIGFRATKFEPVDPDDRSFFAPLRYTEWDWLELSAVTIPANADATITAIKSADQKARATHGAPRPKVSKPAVKTGFPVASGRRNILLPE